MTQQLSISFSNEKAIRCGGWLVYSDPVTSQLFAKEVILDPGVIVNTIPELIHKRPGQLLVGDSGVSEVLVELEPCRLELPLPSQFRDFEEDLAEVLPLAAALLLPREDVLAQHHDVPPRVPPRSPTRRNLSHHDSPKLPVLLAGMKRCEWLSRNTNEPRNVPL